MVQNKVEQAVDRDMEHFADGFEFSLSEGSNVIYVFKGDAFVTAHICLDAERAKLKFKEIKKRKKVIFEK